MPLPEDTCDMGVGGTIEAVQVAAWEGLGTVLSLAGSKGVLVAGMEDGRIVKVHLSLPCEEPPSLQLKWNSQLSLDQYAEVELPEKKGVRGIQIAEMRMLVQTDHEVRALD